MSVMQQEAHLQKKPVTRRSNTESFSSIETQTQWNGNLQVSQVSFKDASVRSMQVEAEHGTVAMISSYKIIRPKKCSKFEHNFFFSAEEQLFETESCEQECNVVGAV